MVNKHHKPRQKRWAYNVRSHCTDNIGELMNNDLINDKIYMYAIDMS